MTAVVKINNMIEAKQKLHDALNILDAISAYSIHQQLPSDLLFDIEVRKRLQSLHPKLPSPIHPLLQEIDGLSEDDKKTLSPYCYKIGNCADDFNDVLGGLEAHYKQMNVQNLTNKGELIDIIIRGGVSKTIKSVAGILDVIGSLALWRIREVEARTLASERGHQLVSQEDKSNAATEMWQHLASYNVNADRAKLDARISAGIRWNRFLGGMEIGMIAAVHKLPLSLKFPTKLILKLALIVTEIPGILDQAKMATLCVQRLLDSRLGPWTGSKKRQLKPTTEAESGTPPPNNHSSSIGALLNAAEHIAAAIQGQLLPSITNQMDLTPPESLAAERSQSLSSEGLLPISGWDATTTSGSGGESQTQSDEERPRKVMRVDSFLFSNANSESIVTPEVPAGLNPQAENVPNVDLSVSRSSIGPRSDQGGMTETTNPENVDLSVPQAQDDRQVEARETNIAEVAEVGRLGDILGDHLFNGMDKTQMRHREKEEGMISFTETVRLHFGCREGEDFKLEVWLCSSVGRAISQAKMRSVEDLRSMLGDCLFDAMKSSICRKEEERSGISDCTGAVDLTFMNGEDSSDCILGVMLSFVMGIRIFGSIYRGTI